MDTLSTQYCTPEQQAISALANAPIHCLTRDESIGLAVCITFLFVRVSILTIWTSSLQKQVVCQCLHA